ncbi:MAG: PKD domain-containing protein [Bacteroidota bacterium]
MTLVVPLIVISQEVDVKIDGFVFDVVTGQPVVEHLVLIETAEDSDIFYADTLYTTLEGYFSTSFQVPQSASAVFFVYTYDCQDGKLLQTLQLNDGQVNPQTVEFPICTGELSCQARFGFRKEAPGTREYVFRNESFGSFSSLLWEIGEEGELGRVENEDEFVFSFPDEGEFKVQLIIFDDANGCNDTTVQYVFVKNDQECFVSFSIENDGSEPGRFFFSGYGSGEFVEWKWEFGDGVMREGPITDFVFSGPGEYQVCLRALDAYGCEAVFCEKVFVGGPGGECRAGFEPEKLDSKTYKFLNRSESNNLDALEFEWFFGDGGSSKERDPEYTYDNFGVYDVCLNIYDPTGECQSSECFKVLVADENVEGCQAAFEFETDEDEPFTVKFYNFSTGGSSTNEWHFGDGIVSYEENPVHTYPHRGLFDVGLLIYNDSWQCWDTMIQQIFIGDPNEGCFIGFGVHPTPENDMKVFFEGHGGPELFDWVWSFGDGTTGEGRFNEHFYQQPGIYEVTVTARGEFGCEASYTDSVKIPLRKERECFANFDYEQIDDSTYKIMGPPPGPNADFQLSYEWIIDGQVLDIKEPVFTYSFQEVGLHEVCLTVFDDEGCQATQCEMLVAAGDNVGECLANMTYDIVSPDNPYTYKFVNASRGEFTYVQWFFNDYSTEEDSPEFQFPGDGIYHVGLLVRNDDWTCWDSTVREIVVGEGFVDCKVEIGFFPDENDRFRIHLEAYTDRPYQRFEWLFPDGTVMEGRKLLRRFPEPGEYEVCLSAFSDDGCEARRCVRIFIERNNFEAECDANFIFEPLDEFTFKFFNQSRFGNPGPGKNYRWDFGDGTFSDERSPKHKYEKPGGYLVCLGIWDSLGCQSSTCDFVIAAGETGECEANYDYTANADDPLTISFENLSRGDYTHVEWHFGDGEMTTEDNPTYTYERPGRYFGGLIIHNEDWSCWDSMATTMTIGEPPEEDCKAWFELIPNPANDLGIKLIGQATGEIEKWEWEFSDGTKVLGPEVPHRFSAPGDYKICLTTTDLRGCVATYCEEVSVPFFERPECIARFNPVRVGSGVFYFDNESRGGTPADPPSFFWDFGDGEVSTEENPLHDYPNNGTYFVSLLMETADGCVDTAEFVARVTDRQEELRCQAKFHYFGDDEAEGRLVNFVSDVDAETDSITYFWDFGDGNTAYAPNPSHVYSEPGRYRACLEITTAEGCVSKFCEPVFIEDIQQPETHSVSGKIYMGDQYPDEVTVYLVTLDIYTQFLYAIDSVTLSVGASDSAFYQFDEVPTGFYLTKAALTESSQYYDDYIPTYYGEKIFWARANFIPLFTDREEIDIQLIEAENPGGPGFISGNIFEGAGKNDPGAEDVQLILLDEEANAIAYTFSDENGYFEFENIPYGNYTVYGESINKEADPVPAAVDENNPQATDVGMEIQESLITGLREDIDQYLTAIGEVYPNPVTGVARLEVELRNTEDVGVYIYDIRGKLMSKRMETIARGARDIQINAESLPAGVYQITLRIGKASVSRKFVKY